MEKNSMIPNPGQYLKDYAIRFFPGINASTMKIVEIGLSAYVDMRVPTIGPDVVMRLMVPHTAPADARPLISNIWVGNTLVWDYKLDEDARGNGVEVFLYRWENDYILVYLSPGDMRRQQLDGIKFVGEILDPKGTRKKPDELLYTRYRVAQKLGLTIILTGSQEQTVKRLQQANRALKKSRK